jgi:hypothetical protein
MYKNLRASVVKRFYVFNKKLVSSVPPCLCGEKGFMFLTKKWFSLCTPCLCGEKDFMFLTNSGFLRASVVKKVLCF